STPTANWPRSATTSEAPMLAADSITVAQTPPCTRPHGVWWRSSTSRWPRTTVPSPAGTTRSTWSPSAARNVPGRGAYGLSGVVMGGPTSSGIARELKQLRLTPSRVASRRRPALDVIGIVTTSGTTSLEVAGGRRTRDEPSSGGGARRRVRRGRDRGPPGGGQDVDEQVGHRRPFELGAQRVLDAAVHLRQRGLDAAPDRAALVGRA